LRPRHKVLLVAGTLGVAAFAAADRRACWAEGQAAVRGRLGLSRARTSGGSLRLLSRNNSRLRVRFGRGSHDIEQEGPPLFAHGRPEIQSQQENRVQGNGKQRAQDKKRDAPAASPDPPLPGFRFAGTGILAGKKGKRQLGCVHFFFACTVVTKNDHSTTVESSADSSHIVIAILFHASRSRFRYHHKHHPQLSQGVREDQRLPEGSCNPSPGYASSGTSTRHNRTPKEEHPARRTRFG
jgi:hypothetical protein